MHYGNVAYRGQRQASRKQESKQARKREALVKGTGGRQEKRETSQLCEQAIPCTAFGAEGTRRNGTRQISLAVKTPVQWNYPCDYGSHAAAPALMEVIN